MGRPNKYPDQFRKDALELVKSSGRPGLAPSPHPLGRPKRPDRDQPETRHSKYPADVAGPHGQKKTDATERTPSFAALCSQSWPLTLRPITRLSSGRDANITELVSSARSENRPPSSAIK